MSDEQHQEADSYGQPLSRDTSMADLLQYWISLDRGWQAICLSAVLVLAVGFGLPIPW